MVEILEFINDTLKENEIPYEFGEWTQDVSYPYFVGTFMETDWRFEDNRSSGTMTIDGWCRGSGGKLALADYADKIKKVFDNLQVVLGERAYFIRYGGADYAPTGDEDLYKVTITLFTEEWEGE